MEQTGVVPVEVSYTGCCSNPAMSRSSGCRIGGSVRGSCSWAATAQRFATLSASLNAAMFGRSLIWRHSSSGSTVTGDTTLMGAGFRTPSSAPSSVREGHQLVHVGHLRDRFGGRAGRWSKAASAARRIALPRGYWACSRRAESTPLGSGDLPLEGRQVRVVESWPQISPHRWKF